MFSAYFHINRWMPQFNIEMTALNNITYQVPSAEKPSMIQSDKTMINPLKKNRASTIVRKVGIMDNINKKGLILIFISPMIRAIKIAIK